MTERKEFELNRQQQRLGVADLFENIANHGVVTGLYPEDLIDPLLQLSSSPAGSATAKRKEDLCLGRKIGVEGTPAPAGFGGDVLNAGSLEAIARKGLLRCAEQGSARPFGAQRLARDSGVSALHACF
jgi:hypothetical protein